MEEKIYLILSLLGTLLIYLQWHFLWKSYFLERYREKLFILRDTLFNYAIAGHISFEDESYVRIRNMINANLRMSHRTNILDLLIFRIFYWKDIERSEKELAEFRKKINLIPEQDPAHIYKIVYYGNLFLSAEHIIRTSPIIWPFILLAICYVIVHKQLTVFSKAAKYVYEKIGGSFESQIEFSNKISACA